MEASLLASTPSTIALLQAGDAVVYDGRLLHCGGPNRAGGAQGDGDGARDGEAGADAGVGAGANANEDATRVLLTLTFRHPDADGEALGNAAAKSLLPCYSGRLKLGQLRRSRPKRMHAQGG